MYCSKDIIKVCNHYSVLKKTVILHYIYRLSTKVLNKLLENIGR